MAEHEIWFDRPAAEWTQALPLGNGKTGAMLFGGAAVETLQLNDATAWSGSPLSEHQEPAILPEVAAAALAEARAAVTEHDYLRATEALKRVQHRHSQTYLPFAEVTIEQHTADKTPELIRRSLDLATATHRVAAVIGGHPVQRLTYISAPAGVLVHEFTSDDPDGVELRIGLTTLLHEQARASSDGAASLLVTMPSDVYPLHDQVADPVEYSDDPSRSMQGALALRWIHDGVEQSSVAGALRATGVHHATVYLTTETTFTAIASMPRGTALDALERATRRVADAVACPAEELTAAHLVAHGELYGRVELTVGGDQQSDLPVDERLRRGNADPAGVLSHDPKLAELLFHYGRYLLISSSREGSVPANLQGIWNPTLQPPWSSNYTTNINVQMNYWMAEIGNLAECLPPLFDLIDGLTITGARTARQLYDAPGWVAHHNTDVWAYSQPVGGGMHDPKWAFWPLAGAWLVRHLWERLLHGADTAFARDRAWGPIRSAAEFYLAWLVEQDDGTLGTSPSTSPENEFFATDGAIASVGRSSAFDLVVIADLFEMLSAIADRLNVHGDPVVDAARAALPRLARPEIGDDGTIKEWADDFEFPDPLHRHVAHLYFLHPGDTHLSPVLAEAASRSLDQRGDESTGWSLAWKLAMRARLGQSAKVEDLLALVFRDMEVDRGPWIGGLYPNLFAAHPPFQIDGNFGFVSGLAECIVQSHDNAIDLLRAVPASLATGRVRGLVARPGVLIDVEWAADETGQASLVEATLRPHVASAVGARTLTYRGRLIEVDLPLDGIRLTREDFETGVEGRAALVHATGVR